MASKLEQKSVTSLESKVLAVPSSLLGGTTIVDLTLGSTIVEQGRYHRWQHYCRWTTAGGTTASSTTAGGTTAQKSRGTAFQAVPPPVKFSGAELGAQFGPVKGPVGH